MSDNTEVQIRIATEADAADLVAIYAPYVEQTAITFEYEVPTVEEFAGRIRSVLKNYPYLVAVEHGRILGYAYVGPLKSRAAYDWSVETSIYVDMKARKRGVGRRLYGSLEAILKLQGILNVNACIGYPQVEDEYLTRDSVSFHERLGYHMIGMFHNCGYKFHRWYHMVWMEKFIGEHVIPQPPIRRFPEIRQQQELFDSLAG